MTEVESARAEKKGTGNTKVGLVVCAILVAILAVSNVWSYTNLQNQIITLNDQKNNLQRQMNTLQSQIDTLNTTYQNYMATHSHSNSEYDDLNTAYQNYMATLLFNHSGYPPSPTEDPQIFITYQAGLQEYTTAILKICQIALFKYLGVFGMSSPSIHVFIYTNASDIILGTTPFNYRIYLYIRSIEDLGPPTMSHPHHVYGFIHEIGHIMFTTDNSIFNEGWANYAAGFRIVSEVYHYLGDNAWPQPYNYSETEGRKRFLSQINNSSLCQPNTLVAASKVLYTIDQKYGPRIFKSAIDKMHPTYYGRYRYPLYTLEEFKTVLADLTNDTAILDLFSEYGF